MPETQTFYEFLKENKKLVKKYMDTKIEIYKLRLIRSFARFAGSILWILISLFLMSLLAIFIGLVTGFWLSEITGSYTKGFGLTALIMMIIILIIAAMRNILFVNPIIKICIRKLQDESNAEDIH